MASIYQESKLEFRKNLSTKREVEFPEIRGIEIYVYGSSLEEMIKKAREQFNLDTSWELISGQKSKY
jgi:hypothetical protein